MNPRYFLARKKNLTMKIKNPAKLNARTKEKIRLGSQLSTEYRLRFAEGQASSDIIDDLAKEYNRKPSTIYALLHPIKRLQSVPVHTDDQ